MYRSQACLCAWAELATDLSRTAPTRQNQIAVMCVLAERAVRVMTVEVEMEVCEGRYGRVQRVGRLGERSGATSAARADGILGTGLVDASLCISWGGKHLRDHAGKHRVT